MRTWFLFALAATLACGGKEDVGGTPVGSCTLGPGNPSGVNQWECTSALVDADGTGPFQQCPANVGAGVSCVISSSSGTGFGAQPGWVGNPPPGFTSVFSSDTLGPCLQCTSNGLGVVWNCASQVWEAGDVFTCGQ